MTMVATGLNYWPPRVVTGGNESFSAAGVSLGFDSSTDRLAIVLTSQYTDSISTVYLRTATTTTGCDVDVRIETVSNGRPSGTLLGTNTNIVVTIANGNSNAWVTCALTAAASITPGLTFAIVVVVSSGTPNMNFAAQNAGVTGFAGQIPVLLQDAGSGTWAAPATDTYCWFVQLTSAGVVALPNLTSMQQTGTVQAFNSGNSPDEYALKFQTTVPRRCIGVSMFMLNNATTGDFTLTLWPASSTTDADALAQASVDTDTFISNTADGYVDIFFDTAVTLSIGTDYYVGVRADTATNLGVAIYTTPSAISNSQRASYVQSNDIHVASRTWTTGTAAAWTDTGAVENQILICSLICDQLDDGTGGGGGGGGQRVIGG